MYKLIVEQSKNLTAVIGLLTIIFTGAYSLGILPVTQSIAQDMITQAIKERDAEWEKALADLQSIVTSSTANNSGKILKTQEDIRKIENTISSIDERGKITLDLLRDMNNKLKNSP